MTLIEPKEKTISRPTLMFRATSVSPKGMVARHIIAGAMTMSGARRNRMRVGAGRDDELLGEELGDVGDGLEPAAVAGLVRAGAALEPAGALALGQHEVGGVDADEGHDADQGEHRRTGSVVRKLMAGALSGRCRG